MTRAYIAADKKGTWYLVVQEGAGSVCYRILNKTPLYTPQSRLDVKAITEEFNLKD